MDPYTAKLLLVLIVLVIAGFIAAIRERKAKS